MASFIVDGETITTADRLPLLPLRDVVVFPYVAMSLLVGRAASLAALTAARGARVPDPGLRFADTPGVRRRGARRYPARATTEHPRGTGARDPVAGAR